MTLCPDRLLSAYRKASLTIEKFKIYPYNLKFKDPLTIEKFEIYNLKCKGPAYNLKFKVHISIWVVVSSS